MVASNLRAYVEAATRREKSEIISSVVNEIRHACHKGGFVKKEKNGEWTEVGPTISREKVSHAFRDSLLKSTRNKEQLKKADRQQVWKEAQDDIFDCLHLRSESLQQEGEATTGETGHASGAHDATGPYFPPTHQPQSSAPIYQQPTSALFQQETSILDCHLTKNDTISTRFGDPNGVSNRPNGPPFANRNMMYPWHYWN